MNTYAVRARLRRAGTRENQLRGGGVGGRSTRANAVASSIANVPPLKVGVGNPPEIGQKRISVVQETAQQLPG
ncbi:MAG TPA: hypothetical protein VFX07_02270 [Candidatus Udaeobacter sp.]|nr:hypothetical protein [Candidatus Udaeobacter sp.]